MTRTDAEIAELIRRVEAEHDLFEPKIDGWSAWQPLRFAAAAEVARGEPHWPSNRRAWSRSELVQRGFADWARYVRLPRARVLAKTFASGLAELHEDGRYSDVFFDDVLATVESSVKLEVQNAPARPAHRPSAATTVGIDLGARVLARGRASRDVAHVAGHLSDVASRELGIAAFDRETLERRLLAFRWARRLYGRILDRVQPHSVLVADTSEFELFAAAKERGIRCIELQHGILGRNHPNVLGAAASVHREGVLVPDALLLFGPYWEDELRVGGFYRDELRVTGSPRIDRFRARRQAHGRAEGALRVLVTSQGVATAELARFLAESLALARAAGHDVRLDVKLHPIYDASSRATYEAALGGESGARILASDEPPSTLDLLSEADAHVSISSTAHYESLGVGVPTIVLPLPGHEEVAPLVEAGHAGFAETPAELVRLLRDTRDQPVSEEVSGRYYRPGAVERIAGELGGRTGV